MSLIGALALSPSHGVCMVTDYDSTDSLFYLLPPVGKGAWMLRNRFTILWTGDMVQYVTLDGRTCLGLITSLDFEDWTIEVMTPAGETGYPSSDKVISVVGRDMPLLSESQQQSVSLSLVGLFVSALGKLPALMIGR